RGVYSRPSFFHTAPGVSPIYSLSLHDALPIYRDGGRDLDQRKRAAPALDRRLDPAAVDAARGRSPARALVAPASRPDLDPTRAARGVHMALAFVDRRLRVDPGDGPQGGHVPANTEGRGPQGRDDGGLDRSHRDAD